MIKNIDNYHAFFYLKVFKNVLYTFLDSFLVLYFLDVSQNNIKTLGIYKLVAVVAIYAVIYGVRNINKTRFRINLLRIGIILDFIYFLTIILLKEKVIDYVYLVGLLYGLEEGFYFSVYNPLESDGIKEEERTRFSGIFTTVSSLLSIVLPVMFGTFIKKAGFINCLLVVLIIIVFRIILSFILKDNNVPASARFDQKGFKKAIKGDKRIKASYFEMFFEGMTISEGAFSYIVTIYIAKVFTDSFLLGIATSVFSIVSAVLGLVFARWLKEKHYLPVMKVVTVCTIASLVYMFVCCNTASIILFKFFYTVLSNIVGLINVNSIQNLSNIDIIKTDFKVEYWLSTETCLVVGRIISNALFILMAYTDSNIIMGMFVVFLALYALSSIYFQKAVQED